MALTVTKTALANKALTLLGSSVVLNSLDDSKTSQAKVLRLHIDSSFESALLAHDWSFATGFTEEPMVVLRECPSSGYAFAYQAPFNSLRIRQVALKGEFVHHTDQYVEDVIQYQEFIGDNGPEVHTNLPYAYAEFTKNISIESSYPSSFTRIASAYLARDAGPGIITDNYAKIERRLEANIKVWINRAIAEDLISRAAKVRPVSPFIRARRPDYGYDNTYYQYNRR